jgi:hypothetical protein
MGPRSAGGQYETVLRSGCSTAEPHRHERTGANGVLNQHCALVPDLESILRTRMRKIALQHSPLGADLAGLPALSAAGPGVPSHGHNDILLQERTFFSKRSAPVSLQPSKLFASGCDVSLDGSPTPTDGIETIHHGIEAIH